MKKNFWAFFFMVFFLFPSHSVQAFSLAHTQKSTVYKFLEPLFRAMGYREFKVHVYDQETGISLENAVVMMGEENWSKTDQDGNVSFDGFTLPQGPLTITAAHKDYSRYTIFDTEATSLNIPISPLTLEHPKSTLHGEFTGWPPIEDHDGIVDVGFVLPFVDIVSLVNFSSEKLVAPYVKAHIYKDVYVPGNLIMPDQEERYFIFPVYLSKPTYQMPFTVGSQQNLIALSGQLPFSKMANGFINKEPLSKLLNLVSINQLGFIQNLSIPNQNTTLDIPLSYTLKPKFNVTVNNPPQNTEIIYVATGFFKDNPNALFPLDFKMNGRDDKAKTGALKSLGASNLFPPLQEMILTVAADLSQNSGSKKRDTSIVGSIKRPLDTNPIYINSFSNPIDLSQAEPLNQFSYQERYPSAQPIASHLSISFIQIAQKGTENKKGTAKTWWTVVAPSQVKEFKLPTLPQDLSKMPPLAPDQSLEWTVNVFGLNENNYIFDYDNLNSTILAQNLTHFSMNTMNIAPVP